MAADITNEAIKEAWRAYIAELSKVPNWSGYDSVSIHNNFPEVKKAFDQYRLLLKLMRTNDEEADPRGI